MEPEYLAGHYCVFLLSARNRGSDLARLSRLIATAPAMGAPLPVDTAFPPARQVLSPREAMFAPRCSLQAGEVLGRVSAGVISRCPPGIPLVMPGEEIDENIRTALNNYGISHVDVIK